MSSSNFYRAFEDRHRGPRELIRKRQEAYRPFIEPLREIYQPTTAIDLGCGRGEWLELLQEAGFQGQGIDLDAGMLAACTNLGLSVTQGEAIAHLTSLGAESQCIVSGFHIAEHIPFDQLEALVVHALRVLKPGGLLILETPNPENLVVGTSGFYLDPTHLRPLPPLLLAFLPEHHGFARVHTVRLQESPELRHRSDVTLRNVLDGVSPDYAVVAQKKAAPEIMARFDVAFSVHYGIDLNTLAERFDSTVQQRMNALDQRLAIFQSLVGPGGDALALAHLATLQDRLLEVNTQLAHKQTEVDTLRGKLSRMQEHEKRAVAAEAHSRAQQTRIDELGAHAHHLWIQASALEVERNALRQSASWRITAPLRLVAEWLKRILRAVKGGVNSEGLHASGPDPLVKRNVADLTPRARQIHADLQAAVENKKK